LDGKDLIHAVEKEILAERGQKTITQQALAGELGISVPTLINWLKRSEWTALQIARLILKRSEIQRARALETAIMPIVEFLELDPVDSRSGSKAELFSIEGSIFLRGLRERLSSSCGVYIFYDSRGRAIYVGKTQRQKTKMLWAEMNDAYNRYRDVQKIKRVDHPTSVEFRAGDEKQRQIYSRSVTLYELASYVSAYEVTPGLISKMEALLVRGFANDLLNIKMEYFGKRKPAGRRK
jgi:transcriptional regulator with XRE-family HTH domain